MKAIKIQARKLLNTCHFYGIEIIDDDKENQLTIKGDVGTYQLERLFQVADDCNMALLIVNGKLTIQFKTNYRL